MQWYWAYSKWGGCALWVSVLLTQKNELSNLHPSKSTPLVRPLAMQAQKQCNYTTTNNSKRLPTTQSLLKTEINNNK